MKTLRIVSEPEELDQGLFGQTFYYILQILPYLVERRIFPKWELRTLHYGDPPNKLTVPGVLEPVYEDPAGPYRTLSLAEIRRRHAHVLGNDWLQLKRMWDLYFRIPRRVLEEADEVFPAGRVLGVHYRGTDKQTSSWDSNPISQEEYIALLQDFLQSRKDFDVLFAATDESSFVERLRRTFRQRVISMGEVEFHLAAHHTTSRAEKADRAMLDCVLLSRCECVIQTSSALPSFAKLLNPSLEIYRSAASKLFGKLYTNMPYFPVAHIPILPVTRPASVEILRRTMWMDWTDQSETRQFQQPFVAVPRWRRNHEVFSWAEQIGIDRVAARMLTGYK